MLDNSYKGKGKGVFRVNEGSVAGIASRFCGGVGGINYWYGRDIVVLWVLVGGIFF